MKARSWALIFATLLFAGPVFAETSADLDKFVGAYRATSILIFYVQRQGNDLHVHVSGHNNDMVLRPVTANKFTGAGAQFIFAQEGHDMVLTAANLPMVYRAQRVSAEAAKAQEDGIAARVKAGVPSAGTESSARRFIESLEDGAPNYDDMEPRVAADAAGRLPERLAQIQKLGGFKSLTFERVSPDGMDVYDAEFEHGHVDLGLAPLDAQGKVEFRDFHVRN